MRLATRTRRWASTLAACVAIASLTLASSVAAAPPTTAPTGAPGQDPAAEPTPPPAPPTWRFRKADRPIKVVLLAGSIGAWPKSPYIKRFEQMCPRVETRNISKVGMGAYQLKQRFKEQVLENRRISWSTQGEGAPEEFWLVFQGGLNSVGMPEKTNRYVRDIFMLAHRRGMRVVGLSLTPWGDDSDAKRWRNAADALRYLAATRKIVDFVVGRLYPNVALGEHAKKRDDPRAPWSAEEVADVGIDLFDSALRERTATLRDRAAVERELESDRRWRAQLAAQPEDERAAWREAQIQAARQVPTWWLRADLRAFDHIHPNTDGHALIAELACPQLPASWGCQCPVAPVAAPAAANATGPSTRDPYF